jgi:eukaryotic-like serine/threonine-protein kinase
MTFEVGQVIDERYRVLGRIGAGRFGVVFRAEDVMTGAKIALKCLSPDATSEPVFRTRMQREARAMGALSGTSATQIFDYSKAACGTLYIAMELLSGEDLEKHLRALEERGERLSIDRLIELLGPIASTLELAHARGIIHRDIKPANIFVLAPGARGAVRLLDFGLAKDVNAAALTKDGTVLGSPNYIAPEVWRGKSQEIDQRVDVYSLGAVIYRALAGQVPFPEKGTMQLLMAVTKNKRPSLHARRPDLPPEVDPWVARALAASPADRFASVSELWSALLTALGRGA